MNNWERCRPPQEKPAKTGPKPRKPIKQIGKRGLKRQAMNRQLNALGIERCEIKIEGVCLGGAMLTWAHSRKSRFLVTDEDWLHACRACIPCHQEAESKSHAEMFSIIESAINKRQNPV